MSEAEPAPIVSDERAAHRFVVEADGRLAELVYRVNGKRFVIVHTEVPDEWSGRGIGGALVQAAVGRARAEGLTVVPVCPFAREWLRRHPDVATTLTIDWTEPPN